MGSIRGDVLYGWLLIRNDPSNSSIIRNDVLTTMELNIKMFVIFLKDAKWSNQINFNNQTGGYEVGPTCEETAKKCPGSNLGIGQIISECPYEIIVSPTRPTKEFPRFLP